MSAEDAKSFLDKVDRDTDLQQQFKEHQANLVKIGKENGYEFTQDELHRHLTERWGVSKPPAYDDPDTCTMCV